jgi:hypothetical protein
VYHEIRGVGFYYGAGALFADYMGLRELGGAIRRWWFEDVTMSQPSFAEAIAEKYGAPV